MACFRPLHGWRAKDRSESGGRAIVFSVSKALTDRPVSVPCGQCIGCRLERSRQWAVRCMHEAQMHDCNSFITLTFDDDNLPDDHSVDVRDVQLFMKRLRKRRPNKIKSFYCGEYGDEKSRPHYHAVLFGVEFPDSRLWSVHNGQRYYTSDELADLWPFGFNIIGDVTFESAAYVARYCTKKINGRDGEDFTRVNLVDGKWLPVRSEFGHQSNGLGLSWFNEFKSDVFPRDFVVTRGHKSRPPRYYDNLLSEDELSHLKSRRVLMAKAHAENNGSNRLRVREKVQTARHTMLKRGYETDA